MLEKDWYNLIIQKGFLDVLKHAHENGFPWC